MEALAEFSQFAYVGFGKKPTEMEESMRRDCVATRDSAEPEKCLE
jgi:hypothetical protein